MARKGSESQGNQNQHVLVFTVNSKQQVSGQNSHVKMHHVPNWTGFKAIECQSMSVITSVGKDEEKLEPHFCRKKKTYCKSLSGCKTYEKAGELGLNCEK